MTPAFLVVAATLAAPGPKEAKPDPLVGVWELESLAARGDGTPVPAGGMRWEFTAGGKVIASFQGTRSESQYKVGLEADPRGIDLIHPPADKRAGKTFAAIYKIEGDRLTVALSNGDTRPTSFETPKERGYDVRVFRRVKPKD